MITVEDTGATTLKFSPLTDAACTNIVPAGEAELKPTETGTFTCEHVLGEADKPSYANVAAITGGGKEKPSEEVEVEVKGPFTIVKEQRIQGEASFTKLKLSAEVGKNVEYKITVLNTDNTSLKFGVLKDAKCAAISPAGETELNAGEEESFSCEHVLVERDENSYKNTAWIVGAGTERTSNTVEVQYSEPHAEMGRCVKTAANGRWSEAVRGSSERRRRQVRMAVELRQVRLQVEEQTDAHLGARGLTDR